MVLGSEVSPGRGASFGNQMGFCFRRYAARFSRIALPTADAVGHLLSPFRSYSVRHSTENVEETFCLLIFDRARLR
jgi:hypothetical protein